jgi:DNA-binding Lrp family transcriptional regulator
MEENGVIHPTVVVDPKVFGYKTAVDIFCETDINKLEEIGQILLQLPEVVYVAYATGDQDISLQALLESSDDIFEFMQKLIKIPGIQRTKTVIVPRILKGSYQWIPTEDDFEEYKGDLPSL